MITVVGSLNFDFIVPVERFPAPGETLHGRDVIGACGGKGANQAYAAARLGAPVAMLGCVGDDVHGDAMLANLRDAGIDVGPVARRPNVSSGIALILVDRSGQNEIVVASGANMRVTLEDVQAQAALIRASRFVVAQFELPSAVTWSALRAAREGGATTVLTPAPFAAFDHSLLTLVDILVPNEIEAGQLAGAQIAHVAGAQAVAGRLRAMGAGSVLITMGERGVWVDSDEWRGHVAAQPVTAVDTVGAGDCFTGALVARLHEGASLRAAVDFACAAAAISVTRQGAQPSMPARAEVDALLARSKAGAA